jgi:hypothetical protein
MQRLAAHPLSRRGGNPPEGRRQLRVRTVAPVSGRQAAGSRGGCASAHGGIGSLELQPSSAMRQQAGLARLIRRCWGLSGRRRPSARYGESVPCRPPAPVPGTGNRRAAGPDRLDRVAADPAQAIQAIVRATVSLGPVVSRAVAQAYLVKTQPPAGPPDPGCG